MSSFLIVELEWLGYKLLERIHTAWRSSCSHLGLPSLVINGSTESQYDGQGMYQNEWCNFYHIRGSLKQTLGKAMFVVHAYFCLDAWVYVHGCTIVWHAKYMSRTNPTIQQCIPSVSFTSLFTYKNVPLWKFRMFWSIINLYKLTVHTVLYNFT